MRIDKYLKLTRLIKRRTVAKELLDRGYFTLNGKVAKPSSEVKIGDIITLLLGKRYIELGVPDIKDFCKKEDSYSLFKIIKEEVRNEAQFEQE